MNLTIDDIAAMAQLMPTFPCSTIRQRVTCVRCRSLMAPDADTAKLLNLPLPDIQVGMTECYVCSTCGVELRSALRAVTATGIHTTNQEKTVEP